MENTMQLSRRGLFKLAGITYNLLRTFTAA